MHTRTSAGWLMAGLAAVPLLAGCSASVSPTPVPATPAAYPAAVTYGLVAVVAGTDDCVIDLGSGTAGPDGVTQYRAGRLACTASVNDPRVSGTEQGTWSRDWWGPAGGPGAGVQWGTVRLENAGGAWEGKATGVASTDRGDIIAIWYTGTRGYAGLSYFELITGKGPWAIRGQIQPGDPPTPSMAQVVEDVTPPPVVTTAPATTAAPQPTPIAYGPVTLVEGSERPVESWGDFRPQSTTANGVAQARGTIGSVFEMNDPRVSGVAVGDLNMDGTEDPGNGAAIEWGSSRLNNDKGSWTGTYTGVYDSVNGDTYVGWWTGSGALAGLSFFLLGAGGPPNTVYGLIYPGTPPEP